MRSRELPQFQAQGVFQHPRRNEAVAILRRLMSSKDERISHQAAWRLIYQRIEMARLAVKVAAQVPFLPSPAASRVEQNSKGLTNEQRAQSIINVLEPITGTKIPLPALLAHFGQ